MTSKTEQIEIQTTARQYRKVWADMMTADDSNFESRKQAMLDVHDLLGAVDAEMRDKIYKAAREN